jgi:transposase
LALVLSVVTTDGSQIASFPATLPTDVAACHAMIRQLLQVHQQKDRTIESLEHRLDLLLRKLYGRSAEKIDPQQMALFVDLLKQLEGQPATAPTPAIPPTPPPTSRRNGHGRRKLPADLPRERRIHDLPAEQRPCPCCGQRRELIGQETSEQLDWVPAQVKVIEHVRLKYACKACEAAAAETGAQIVLAAKPLAAIEKCLAAPGLLAYVTVSRFADHLPYYRLQHILARHHIQIARSTLGDWEAQVATALTPLYKLMIERTLGSRILHTDDTPVDVLEPGRGKTRTGRFWVYVGDDEHRYVVFDYTPSRSRDGPMAFLKNWGRDLGRYLQADAFGGYDGIYAGDAGGRVTEAACWAHARRKFFEAQNAELAVGTQALAYIRLLYDIEDQAKDLSSAERARIRQEQAAPILVKFRAWLAGQQAVNGGPVLPKSPMGQAITYALNQWAALCVYLLDGELDIDNNVAENAVRRIALGRKNWLFCGSDQGGRTAAILFSLIATCQRHEVNAFDYLCDVLTRIAATPISRLPELLPDRWKAARAAAAAIVPA